MLISCTQWIRLLPSLRLSGAAVTAPTTLLAAIWQLSWSYCVWAAEKDYFRRVCIVFFSIAIVRRPGWAYYLHVTVNLLIDRLLLLKVFVRNWVKKWVILFACCSCGRTSCGHMINPAILSLQSSRATPTVAIVTALNHCVFNLNATDPFFFLIDHLSRRSWDHQISIFILLRLLHEHHIRKWLSAVFMPDLLKLRTTVVISDGFRGCVLVWVIDDLANMGYTKALALSNNAMTGPLVLVRHSAHSMLPFKSKRAQVFLSHLICSILTTRFLLLFWVLWKHCNRILQQYGRQSSTSTVFWIHDQFFVQQV